MHNAGLVDMSTMILRGHDMGFAWRTQSSTVLPDAQRNSVSVYSHHKFQPSVDERMQAHLVGAGLEFRSSVHCATSYDLQL